MPPGDAPLVPDPPPPRPARRDAAIDAAMRRFDGVEDPPRTAPDRPRRSWAGRPQLAWAMTAGLVVIIGLPTGGAPRGYDAKHRCRGDTVARAFGSARQAAGDEC